MQHIVKTNAELARAIGMANGGDEILLDRSGSPYSIDILNRSFEGDGGLSIRSADPDNPSAIATIDFKSASHITIENVEFDSSSVYKSRPEWLNDINIIGGEDITIRDSRMIGTATEFLTRDNPEAKADNMGLVRYIDGFTFENNFVSNYNFGLNLRESENVVIRNNEITALQGDPLRIAGLIDAVVEGNYLHDLIGSDITVNHMDLIQLWSSRTTNVTENLTIRGNILDAGDGVGAQSIFMRNEQVDRSGGTAVDRFYKNIVVTENVIYNGQLHGVTVGETNGLTIANNTLVTNPAAGVMAGDELRVSDPSINVADLSRNVRITDNITAKINAPAQAVLSGNVLVDYNDGRAENSVDNLFVNAGAGVAGLQAKPGGLLDGAGAGASATQYDSSPDGIRAAFTIEKVAGSDDEYRFDAGLSADASGALGAGAVYRWTFEDGTSLRGETVVKTFADFGEQKVTLVATSRTGETSRLEAKISVDDPVLLDIDVRSGAVADRSSYASRLDFDGRDASESGYVVKRGEALSVNRTNEQIFQLEEFTLAFDFKRDSANGGAGKLASIHKSFELRLKKSGELSFEIETYDGAKRSLKTSGADIADTDWHRIALVFDGDGGDGGGARIYVDGRAVGQIDVSGGTKPLENWPLQFGSTISYGVAGAFDDIKLQARPLSAAEINSDFRAFLNDRAGLGDDLPPALAIPEEPDEPQRDVVEEDAPVKEDAVVDVAAGEGDLHVFDATRADNAGVARLDFGEGDEIHIDGLPSDFFAGETFGRNGETFVIDSLESLVRLISHKDVSLSSATGGGVIVDIDVKGDADLALRIGSIGGEPAEEALKAAAQGVLRAGDGADNVILTLGANDVIAAGAGDDVLHARDGDDWLLGGAGADRLTGDAGSDTMEGGAGGDKFVIDGRDDNGGDVDRITDLNFDEGDLLVFSAFGAGAFDGDYKSLRPHGAANSGVIVRSFDDLADLGAIDGFSLRDVGADAIQLTIETAKGGDYALLIDV